MANEAGLWEIPLKSAKSVSARRHEDYTMLFFSLEVGPCIPRPRGMWE